MKGGPALHHKDRHLFENGVLSRHHVYTLRKGEAVRNFDETLMELNAEIVKIKGTHHDWACFFFDADEKRCTIYEARPLECRALQCWNLSGLKKAMKTRYLNRRDLIDPDDGIVRLITAHEQRCSYAKLKAAVIEMDGPESENGVESVLDLLQYDDFMRPFLIKKLGLHPDTMDFLFGRPLTETIHMFGLALKRNGEDHILVPLKKVKA
jgi:Fe-S-cluster containining protein